MSREIARDVLRTEADAILRLIDRLDESFDRAVEIVLRAEGRVVVSGMGKSGIIGRKIAATLASTGTPAFFIHPAEAVHGDLGMMVAGDIVLALSHSGETAEIVRLFELVRRLDLKIVALVGEADSTLARSADVALECGVDREACPLGLAPTASTTAALAMGDALAMALAHHKGFDESDFLRRHPGGRLGRKLVRAQDLMHSGAPCPTVQRTATVLTAVAEITRGGFGTTAVIDDDDRVWGVLTDGDVRRLLQKGLDFTRETVGDNCTRAPRTIRRDEAATRALALMEESSITSLLVADTDGRLEGLIHIHDLWRLEMF